MNSNSILGSVKKLLGSDDYFDTDLIIHINTVLNILTQLGVGPEEGFAIEDEDAEWSDFVNDPVLLNMVKSYVPLRVKLMFDTSTDSSYYIEQVRKNCDELEWRINSQVDYHNKNKEASE